MASEGKKDKPAWKRDRIKGKGKVRSQVGKALARQKYGPRMKPGTVTVKRLDTGEVVAKIPPTTYRQRQEIMRLRDELGIWARKIPVMSNEAERLLVWLRQRAAKQKDLG